MSLCPLNFGSVNYCHLLIASGFKQSHEKLEQESVTFAGPKF